MFTKLIHFAKMSWMLIWRLLLVNALVFHGGNDNLVFAVALIGSFISVFVFNRTLATFPLIRLFRKRPIVVPADGFGDEARPARPRPAATRPTRGPGKPTVGTPGLGSLSTASTNGRMTGFEPSTLKATPVPNVSTMVGRPGAGLQGAAGMTQTNIDLGVIGEENFAKALSITGQIRRFGTVWSVPVPDQDRFIPGPYGTDIDCVLATGSALFLIDLKNYKSGDVRYHSEGNELFCDDVATGKQVGDVKTMSRNMEMATNAVRRHFPGVNIVPVVVFMPTDKGEGVLDNVVWPGGVPAMNLTEFLSVLANQQNFDWNMPHAGALGRMGNLLTMGASKV